MQPSEEIKAKLDIVDFIKDYIQLTPAGVNFRARCPFHNEKSPSFVVSPDKQIWHCFGCGKGGDIFKFLMELENIEFVEALKILAQKAGVELRRQNPQEVSERVRLLDIMDISRRFYHKYLLESPAAAPARKYLAGRGLTADALDTWQIGFGPESWDGLYKVLKAQGYRETEILKTGMIIQNAERRSYYDRFRGRIMFPINDANGNVVAFSARVSPEKEKTETMGKYINSPQTVLYNKSQVLFGLDKAKQAIKQADQVIIVEGQMDAITAHENGYRNVVASSGTALTREQITLLKRFTNNFALSFDTDAAGHMAADRGIREAMKQDVNVRVIGVPDGKDPDECIRKNKAGWERAVEEARHMMAYYFDRTFMDLDPRRIEHKRQAAARLLPIIADLANPIERSYWMKTLSDTIEIEESVLREAIRQKASAQPVRREPARENEQPVLPPAPPRQPKTKEEQFAEFILALLIRFPDLIEYAQQTIVPEQIAGLDKRTIYKALIFYYNNRKQDPTWNFGQKSLDLDDFSLWLNAQEVINVGKSGANSEPAKTDTYDQLTGFRELVVLGDREYYELDYEQAKAEIIRIIIQLKKGSLMRRLRELESLIAKAERERDDEASQHLMEELKLVSDEYRGLIT